MGNSDVDEEMGRGKDQCADDQRLGGSGPDISDDDFQKTDRRGQQFIGRTDEFREILCS